MSLSLIPQTQSVSTTSHMLSPHAVVIGGSIIMTSGFVAGPAESLFKESYYQLMKAALRNGGILCSQGNYIKLSHMFIVCLCIYLKKKKNFRHLNKHVLSISQESVSGSIWS